MYLQTIQLCFASFEVYINGVMLYFVYELLHLLHVIHLRSRHTDMRMQMYSLQWWIERWCLTILRRVYSFFRVWIWACSFGFGGFHMYFLLTVQHGFFTLYT